MSGSEGKPSFLEMIRAPFLFAIVVPLVSGTLVSSMISNSFQPLGFLLVFIIGISLHITTNVYNDIYDTLQGADNRKSMKSEFSGGSGTIVDHPELLPKMYLIARSGIAVGLVGTVLLTFLIDRTLWLPLWIVISISVFLSKYYTAEPFKLAYRGMGELAVVIGFGPLAVLLAGFGQNVGFHPILLSISPITGFGTLFIVWMGEMVDLPTDIRGKKLGLVARIGFSRAKYGLIGIHIIALVNVLVVVVFLLNPGWPLFIAFTSHAILLPKMWSELKGINGHDSKIRYISKLNFRLYASFSILLMMGYAVDLILI
ncbi:MAG: prenyltransferase [Thermoplasmatota archaeon]